MIHQINSDLRKFRKDGAKRVRVVLVKDTTSAPNNSPIKLVQGIFEFNIVEDEKNISSFKKIGRLCSHIVHAMASPLEDSTSYSITKIG